jgi:hypothetical protein
MRVISNVQLLLEAAHISHSRLEAVVLDRRSEVALWPNLDFGVFPTLRTDALKPILRLSQLGLHLLYEGCCRDRQHATAPRGKQQARL